MIAELYLFVSNISAWSPAFDNAGFILFQGSEAAMRSRSNSGVRLDRYAKLVQQTILCHQVRSQTSPFPCCPSRVLY